MQNAGMASPNTGDKQKELTGQILDSWTNYGPAASQQTMSIGYCMIDNDAGTITFFEINGSAYASLSGLSDPATEASQAISCLYW